MAATALQFSLESKSRWCCQCRGEGSRSDSRRERERLFNVVWKLWASARREWGSTARKVWGVRLLKLGGSARREQEPRTSSCGGPVIRGQRRVGWVGREWERQALVWVGRGEGQTGRRIPFLAGWERLVSFCGGGERGAVSRVASAYREGRKVGTSLLTQKRGLMSMFRDLRKWEKRGLCYIASRLVVFFTIVFIR